MLELINRVEKAKDNVVYSGPFWPLRRKVLKARIRLFLLP